MDDPHLLMALKDVLDPALGINIVDLGLVERARWTADGIEVEIALPPQCPASTPLLEQTRAVLDRRFPEARAIRIVRTERPWSLDRLTGPGLLALGSTDDDPDDPEPTIEASVLEAPGRSH
ncbi:metal-sulfur cluster assembly factor [Rhodoplanes serenus]|jgi:metal-sulfur cluster biosynthetic enzyme|uniref:metal-sulfur cluster assembly factor n=1 Tax=Rhodoplanes serenus TaxID=200615 RepID=UPI000DAB474D|nr:iron-sulfur cluster assembly protein [Rhodoplanes serenus]RAI33152.1 hypothetical protein CH340_13155 [Rhodoplanes serenus]